MALHPSLGTGNIHIPHNWSYADKTARESATGFVAGDLYKLAYQEDNNTLWLLIATTPTWAAVSGPGATAFTDLTDTPGSYSGQGDKVVAVKSTEDGLEFIPAGTADKADTLFLTVLKASSGTISKGEAVYISGYAGGYPTVEKAKSDSSSTMPAVGIANGPITDSASGDVTIAGHVPDLDTSSWAEGTPLYVSPTTEGAMTSSKPQSTNKIQKIAQVIRQDASDGEIVVFGAGRSNDLPNLAQDYEWEGDTNGVPQQVVRYGAAREYAEDDTEDTTASTTYQQKLRLTTSSLLAGTYKIAWYSEVGSDVKVKDVQVRVQVDDTTTIAEILTAVANVDGYFCFVGFKEMALSAASHTIDIDYSAAEAGVTAAIRRARISCKRVA